MIKPVRDYILVLKDPPAPVPTETVTESGVIIPHQGPQPQKPQVTGKIVAVGPDKVNDYKVKDTIVFMQGAGHVIIDEETGKEYHLMQDGSILAKLV
jgi:co-chaperonin GroES (HSP10)